MTIIKPAGRYANIGGCWCAWCEQGDTADEIRRRLAEVPEHLREEVRDHCRTVWLLRKRMAA